MGRFEQLTRRAFVRDLGKGTLAIAVLGVAACSDPGAGATTAAPDDESGTTSPPTASQTSTTTTIAPATTEPPGSTQPAGDGVAWERVDLGFVSAYLLVRGAEVAIVDTGVAGSAGAIEQVLASIELSWDEVGHVLLTHLHPDHIGSLGDVMTAADQALGYAGAEDISAMGASPRPIEAVGDGDTVFGLEIIETPGHTPGHICVLDPIGGLLVAGDALNGGGPGVLGPNADFTPDMATANESVKKLADLHFDTVVFGHGEPMIGGASDLVASLAGEL
jgi:glyoxylase-like metal-dependent hydrolase (beta-lactamase superfamily II)